VPAKEGMGCGEASRRLIVGSTRRPNAAAMSLLALLSCLDDDDLVGGRSIALQNNRYTPTLTNRGLK
jgi:hypothetical protein